MVPQIPASINWKELFDGQLNLISDRILTLIRAFWVREYGDKWSRDLDVPPMRWFNDPLTEGTLKGAVLDLEKYNCMLDIYYQKRGWDKNGVPKKETLEKLGLADVASQLNVQLSQISIDLAKYSCFFSFLPTDNTICGWFLYFEWSNADGGACFILNLCSRSLGYRTMLL